MNTKEIREKTDSELQQEVESLLHEQFKLKMQRGTGQPVKTHRFKEIKKEIARIKTISHARSLESSK